MRSIEKICIHASSILGATSCTLSLLSTIYPVTAIPAAVCSVAQTAITAYALKKIYSQRQFNKKTTLLLAGGIVLSTVGAALNICNVLQYQGLFLSSTDASLDIATTTVSGATTSSQVTSTVCSLLVGCNASYLLGLTSAISSGTSIICNELFLFFSRKNQIWISPPSTEPTEEPPIELTEVIIHPPIDENLIKQLETLRKQKSCIQYKLLQLNTFYTTNQNLKIILERHKQIKSLQKQIGTLFSTHPRLATCCNTFDTSIQCKGNLIEYLLGEYLFSLILLDRISIALDLPSFNLTAKQRVSLEHLTNYLKHRLKILKLKTINTLKKSTITTLTTEDELLILTELVSWLKNTRDNIAKETLNLDSDKINMLQHFIDKAEHKIAALTV